MRHSTRQSLALKVTMACGRAGEAIARNDRSMALTFLQDAENAWGELQAGMKHNVLAEKLPAEQQAEKALHATRKVLVPAKHLN